MSFLVYNLQDEANESTGIHPRNWGAMEAIMWARALLI